MSVQPTWRKAVRAAARQAALVESHTWCEEHWAAFNYRWELFRNFCQQAIQEFNADDLFPAS